ncbi:peroxide stress protein YaaA [Arcanobacterium phocisimile]|uniref:Peroxide stress protein YaaA n=1 Tax=Arcanobacterium phocisimile TaxID=1302235 RepID=A0ABX7II74_9ACTO|nr:peroxide stress protein YaaA [Arcanobacterium phocisimile]QRV02838.1 peroxide stress protein YaaA [Arcanobacterium phocisimile]
MLILLPPSEGKTQPTSGPSLDLQSLSFPQFSDTRRQLINELIAVSQRDDALKILKVGNRLEHEVRRQSALWDLPCARASEIYTGVLFHALDFASATADDMTRADNHILIFSGLFGLTRPSDLIPAYRLAMGSALPDAGNTKTLWKQALKNTEFAGQELVIDARSGAYRVWDPPREAEHVLINAVRIKNGERKVVSHNAKHYRGLLAGALIRSATVVDDAEELAEFAHTLVDDGVITGVELDPPGKTRTLTLVENLDRG